MKWLYRISNFFATKTYRQALLLFVVAIVLFATLQWTPTFADPDSFYHAKMAQELLNRGVSTQFPWLSATTLRYEFVDHEFLYHAVLIPFVTFFDPLVGLKVATVLFAALAIVALFLLLRDLHIRGAFWFTLFLLTVNPFVFRITLAKAQPLVMIFLLFFFFLLFRRYYLSLVFISFLYVWLYAGWPLIVGLTILYGFTQVCWWLYHQGWTARVQRSWQPLWQNLLELFAVLLGVVAGIFFSPYFPINLKFYWQQSFQIAIVNYQSKIGVGAEWYPYPIRDLLMAASPLFVLAIIALVIFVVAFKRQSMQSWFFAFVAFAFFVLTLKSRRYVEYLMPMLLIFSAVVISQLYGTWEPWLRQHLPRSARMLLLPIIFLALSPVFYHDLAEIRGYYNGGYGFSRFAAPMQWLQQHAQPADIVFHSDWDEFPLLFYHNDSNYYLVGLDPTFMYEYDHQLYQKWADITRGKPVDDLYGTVKDLFGARYVFVDTVRNQSFDQNLAHNFYFEKVYENDEARIYRVIE